jgi:RES domain-containing protein
MKVYRISRTKYAHDLTGTGAKLYGGRWNKKGTAAIYTSEARSLAMLELVVHFNSIVAFEQSYSYITLEIDEREVLTLDVSNLPKNNIYSSESIYKELGDQFLFKKNMFALRVPSVLVPKEYNIILNPMNEIFNQIKIEEIVAIDLDQRFKNLAQN